MIDRMNMHRVEAFGLESKYAVWETKTQILPNGETKKKRKDDHPAPAMASYGGCVLFRSAYGCVRAKYLEVHSDPEIVSIMTDDQLAVIAYFIVFRKQASR